MTPKDFKEYIIDRVYKEELARHKFSSKRSTFTKKEEGFIKIFNIELSQFNYGTQFGYWINIGLFFPKAYNFRLSDFYGDEEFIVPSNPKIADCQFHLRADELFDLPKTYDINLKINHDFFEKTVRQEINEVFIPFFNSVRNLEDCIQVIKKYTKINVCEIWVALTYASLGEFDRSKNLIYNFIEKENPSLKIKKKIFKAFKQEGLTLDILPEDEERIDLTKGSYP